jgi:hypothetical protein
MDYNFPLNFGLDGGCTSFLPLLLLLGGALLSSSLQLALATAAVSVALSLKMSILDPDLVDAVLYFRGRSAGVEPT